MHFYALHLAGVVPFVIRLQILLLSLDYSHIIAYESLCYVPISLNGLQSASIPLLLGRCIY
jgi:hypothetical protein